MTNEQVRNTEIEIVPEAMDDGYQARVKARPKTWERAKTPWEAATKLAQTLKLCW